MKKLFLLCFIIAWGLVIALPQSAAAQGAGICPDDSLAPPVDDGDPRTQSQQFVPDLGFCEVYKNLPKSRYLNFPDLNEAIGYSINSVRAILIFFGILIAGLMYVMAGGDPEQAKKAQNALKWTVIAMIVVILSLYLVRVLNTFISTVLLDADQGSNTLINQQEPDQ